VTNRTLGQYRVLEKLGAGGMGEVYRARDTRLNRDVAIKVLPEAFARDPERLARFEREAQLLASLNHQNIAAIYGFEKVEDIPFLVLELAPGETLKGPLPLEEALDIARQIAAALEAAHEKGIGHRDLKPANIKVSPQGKVKVLDFGLAKAFAGEASEGNPSQSPTLSALATRLGTILGTAAYMSPEQARGRPLDRRTDIWSFGCVLYEMLAGKQAFGGETISDTLAAVLRAEPDWSLVPATTPERIQYLLRRSLHKDSEQRLRDIGEARILIAESALAPSRVRPVASSRLHWALIALLTAVAAWGWWRARPTPSPITRSTINLPPGDRLVGNQQPLAALSPDGARLVYAATRGGRTQLFQRRLDQFDAAPIPATEDAFAPFFSPDGEWVGFFAQGKLKKVPLSGGAPLALCDAPQGPSGSWGPDDAIIFTPNTVAGTGLWRVPAGGGSAKAITTPDAKAREHSHRWPQILPGGKAVLFTVFTGSSPDENRISVLRLDTGERRVVMDGASCGRYVPTGHLVYARSGGLLAAPFDLRRLQVTGRQVPILEGVMTSSTGAAHFSFSSAGSLAYVPGSLMAAPRAMVWVDRKGATTQIARVAGAAARASPDGRRIALHVVGQANHDIWIYDLARDALTRLTFDPSADADPVWTPDGKRVVFRSVRTGAGNLWWKAADGSGAEERLTDSPNTQIPTSFSSDGKWLAYQESTSGGVVDIVVLPVTLPVNQASTPGAADRKPKPFLQTPFWEGEAQFAPGPGGPRWLAYVSNETGRYEIYVQPFPGPGGKWQISAGGGREPAWSPNGRELFYRNGNQVMAVEVTPGTSFTAGKPRLLFEGQYFSYPGFINFDAAPDGQRFLLLAAPEAALTQLHLIQNWFEELKQRAR